jgi:tetratricopeptide (TPR) repeat protein
VNVCVVKVKVEVDGQVVFEHPRMDDLSQLEPGVDCQKYDLEEYFLPPVIRKVLKTTKLTETFQVRCLKSAHSKVVPYFQCKEAPAIFNKQLLEGYEKEVVYTVCLVAMEQKDYLFKLPIAEKLERLGFLKAVGTDFFKLGLSKKALKQYGKVHSYFRTKDAKNNFQKEEEGSEEFVRMTRELEALHKTTLTNICVLHAKNKDWKDVIKYADEALLMDAAYVKALYHKGRALLELTEYAGALQVLEQALAQEPDNAEVKKEMARA